MHKHHLIYLIQQTETIDPSLLPDIASHTGDYVPDVAVIDVNAAAAIPIELNNEDINDPAVAVAAALSSDEELAVVVADSDEDDDMLEGSMVVTHIWSGCHIRYVFVLLLHSF
jgi:hypothetical protein